MVRIANRRTLPNIYTSYVVPVLVVLNLSRTGGLNMIGQCTVW
jgi:hypothetical protein